MTTCVMFSFPASNLSASRAKLMVQNFLSIHMDAIKVLDYQYSCSDSTLWKF